MCLWACVSSYECMHMCVEVCRPSSGQRPGKGIGFLRVAVNIFWMPGYWDLESGPHDWARALSLSAQDLLRFSITVLIAWGIWCICVHTLLCVYICVCVCACACVCVSMFMRDNKDKENKELTRYSSRDA